eukprot:gene137-4383_t
MSKQITSKDLKLLIKKKEDMEELIEELTSGLKKSGGITGALVDQEGFPRSDIDVHQTLIMRNKLNCLKTDYKFLMKEIEEGMYALHATYKTEEKKVEEKVEKKEELIEEINIIEKKPVLQRKSPFLTVNSVAEGSPAQETGLEVNDEICKFGDIEKKELDTYGLKILADYVQKNVNNKLKIQILRKNKDIMLTFTPKTWNGKGLLGCYLVPIK